MRRGGWVYIHGGWGGQEGEGGEEGEGGLYSRGLGG